MLSTLLAPHRARDDFRIDDLVHHAAEIVTQVAGPQLRYKVTPIPDARTVRFYIQEGLVDPPHGTSGAAALYGYRHLLQLVTVKVLQGHYLPLSRIRETLDKLSNRELEMLLKSWRAKSPDPFQVDLLQNSFLSLGASRKDPPIDDARQATEPDTRTSAQSFLKSIQKTEEPQPHPSRLSQYIEGPGWARHELYPGIELHVRHGVQLPPGTSFFSALASRMRVILEKLGQGNSRRSKT